MVPLAVTLKRCCVLCVHFRGTAFQRAGAVAQGYGFAFFIFFTCRGAYEPMFIQPKTLKINKLNSNNEINWNKSIELVNWMLLCRVWASTKWLNTSVSSMCFGHFVLKISDGSFSLWIQVSEIMFAAVIVCTAPPCAVVNTAVFWG